MKIMMSSCLVGKNVMYWGGNIQNEFLKEIWEHPDLEIVHFCPEDLVLGTPRNNMLIHGGDGRSVWDGIGKILDTEGKNLTELMKSGATKMLEFAKREKPDLIILTEGSDSCGTQVILDPESLVEGQHDFKKSQGHAAFLLIKNGFKVLGHKNEKDIYNFLGGNLNILRPELLKNFEG